MLYKLMAILFSNADVDIQTSSSLEAFKEGFNVMISPTTSYLSVSLYPSINIFKNTDTLSLDIHRLKLEITHH